MKSLDMKNKKKSKKRKLQDLHMEPTLDELGSSGIKKVNNWDKPKSIASFKITKMENKRRKERELRFSAITPEPTYDDDPTVRLSSALSASRTPGEATKSTGKIVGTCTKVEKSYLRLTTFPNVKDIRPLPILQKALQLVKTKYVENEDFSWANDQLKSIRQDMTVQGIRTEFCLETYEVHARILLEHGDLSEFNQCQSMIRSITLGTDIWLEDATVDKPWSDSGLLQQTAEHRDEFGAYQLLYSLVQNSWCDLSKALGEVPCSSGHSCQHAIQVVKSVIHNDYHAFFRLYESSPHLSVYLMDFLLKRVRKEAYDRIVASYRPTIGVEYIRETLQFPSLEDTRIFLKKNGAIFVEDSASEFAIDCKASHGRLRQPR